LKIITIRQPWPFAMLTLGKDVENRSWPTSYTGPVLIHAGKALTRPELESAISAIGEILEVGASSRALWKRFESMPESPNDYVRGAVVAVAELVGCVRRPARGHDSEYSRWHWPGLWGHRFTKIVALERPVPWRGVLGYTEAPKTLIAAVNRSLKSPG